MDTYLDACLRDVWAKRVLVARNLVDLDRTLDPALVAVSADVVLAVDAEMRRLESEVKRLKGEK